ncbi:MAG: hypothetical protein ACJAYU_005436 [Bradymonadia bacterium]
MIDGKYRIEGVLGEGSFGWVFMASHARVQALSYAVKVLKAEHTSDSETVARFHREAETVASLRSKHSVRVTDYGVDQELPYIVMEFVDGLSIGEMLLRGGPLPETDVLDLSMDILRALDEAHRLGIVHRDLKPDNVIVVVDPDTQRPVARVLDFGLAKILEPENFQVRPEATAAGLVMCTARYASPDLLKGMPSPQSDIYALGISMIEMLDGRPPYGGDDFYTVAAKHIAPEPVPMAEASAASVLAPFIRKCTEKHLERRYLSAAEALAELERIQRELKRVHGERYRDTVSGSMMARFTVVPEPEKSGSKSAVYFGASALLLLLIGVALFAVTRSGAPMTVTDDLSALVPADDEIGLEVRPGQEAALAAELAEQDATHGEEVPQPEVSLAALSLAQAHGRLAAHETRSIAVQAAVIIVAAAPAPEPESERRSDRTQRRDDRSEAESEEESRSPSDGESGTDAANLFGGIRTIGGQ